MGQMVVGRRGRTAVSAGMVWLLLIGVSFWCAALSAQAPSEPATASPGGGNDAAPATDDAAAADSSPNGSSPDALVAYSDAANIQNSGEFALAAEEWEKFLQKYGDDPQARDARYNLGVCQLQLQQYEAAITSLQEVVKGASEDFQRLEDAYLNLGSAQYSLGLQNNPPRFAEAAETFGELLQRFPQGNYHDQALFFRGEALYVSQQPEAAAEAYRALLDQHPDSSLRADTLYALGATLESLGQFAAAGQLYDQFLQAFGDHALATEIRLRKAETVFRGGDLAEAQRQFGQLATVDGFALADHALYRQAYCVSQLGQFPEAAKLFARLVERFPQSRYAAEATMAAARSFYRADADAEAETWFARANALEGSPYRAEIAHWRARLRLRQQQPHAALAIAQEALPQLAAEDSYLPSLKLDEADAGYEIAELKPKAVEQYTQLAQQFPDHPVAGQALYNAAFGEMELGRFDAALALAQQFEQRYPDHRLAADVRHVAAQCLLKTGKFEQAESIFAELRADVDQPDVQGQWALGQLLASYLAGKYTEAIQMAQQQLPGLKVADEQAEAYYLLGLAQLATEQPTKAVSALQSSREASPDWARGDEVLLNLAVALSRQGDAPGARQALEQLLERYPDSGKRWQANYRLAEITYGSGDYAHAQDQYTRLLSQLKTAPPAETAELEPLTLYGRAWAELQQKQFAAAVADWDALLQRYAAHRLASKSLYAKAMAHQQAGEFQLGLTDLERLLGDANPSPDSARQHLDALYVRALCQTGLGDHAGAIATLRSLLAAPEADSYPRRDRVLYELAWAHKSAGDIPESLKVFQQLTQAYAGGTLAAEGHYHLGESQYAANDFDQAVASYTAALSPLATDEVREKSLYKLAWSHYQLKDYPQAIARFEELLDVARDAQLVADSRFMRGECLFQQQEYEPALEALTTARQSSELNSTMRGLLLLHGGQAAAQLEKWETALDWLDELIEQQPQSPLVPQARFEQGEAFHNLGQADRAMQMYEMAAGELRSEVGARGRFMMGELLFEKKDYAASVQEFQRVVLGFGGKQSAEAIRPWQARAGIEAGRCFELLAAAQRDPAVKSDYLRRAEQYFQYVVTEHKATAEAQAATEQLRKYRR